MENNKKIETKRVFNMRYFIKKFKTENGGDAKLDPPTFSLISRMNGLTKEEIVKAWDENMYESMAKDYMVNRKIDQIKQTVAKINKNNPKKAAEKKNDSYKADKNFPGHFTHKPFADLLDNYKK